MHPSRFYLSRAASKRSRCRILGITHRRGCGNTFFRWRGKLYKDRDRFSVFCLLIHFPFEPLLPGKQQSPFWSLPQHSQSNFTKTVLLGQVVVSLTFLSIVFLVIHSCTRRFVAHTHFLVPRTSTIMKIIFYLAAMLAIVGAAVATQDSCWCEPTYEGEPSRKSPECCY